jgi:hypothetical protein
VSGVDALGLTILENGRPKWVRLKRQVATYPAGSVIKVIGWDHKGRPSIKGRFVPALKLGGFQWEPAEPPPLADALGASVVREYENHGTAVSTEAQRRRDTLPADPPVQPLNSLCRCGHTRAGHVGTVGKCYGASMPDCPCNTFEAPPVQPEPAKPLRSSFISPDYQSGADELVERTTAAVRAEEGRDEPEPGTWKVGDRVTVIDATDEEGNLRVVERGPVDPPAETVDYGRIAAEAWASRLDLDVDEMLEGTDALIDWGYAAEAVIDAYRAALGADQ